MTIPEAFYQRALATHLAANGMQVREEFCYGKKRFDTIAYDGTRIHGFEVKCRDWPKAIKQARYQQLCCDLVSIVIPSHLFSTNILLAAEREGLGLVIMTHPPRWSILWARVPENRGAILFHRRQLLMLSGWGR